MTLRFRKSIKLAPGVRMSIGSSGVSWNLGPRGASVSIGKRGTYLNSGIPGLGISSRARLDGKGSSSRSSSQTVRSVSLTMEVTDEGEVIFKDGSGAPASDEMIAAAKAQKGDHIRAMILTKCDQINGAIESLGEIHLYTPPPSSSPQFCEIPFTMPRPIEPTKRKYGLLALLFAKLRARVDSENSKLVEAYTAEVNNWEDARREHQKISAKRKADFEGAMKGSSASMEVLLEQTLQEIVWPQETLVGINISADGSLVALDVDLPEIEQLPTKLAAMPAKGIRFSVKEMPKTHVQKLYMRHIHAIGFRLIGETFASLPSVNQVTLSAYSQRPNKATAHVQDDYLYSVKVQRSAWQAINFSALPDLDVVAALDQFELRRNMSVTGIFKAIEPFPIAE